MRPLPAAARDAAPADRQTRQVLDGFRRIVQALRASSRAAEKRVGLSGAQLFVLRAVGDAPGLSLNDLAERTRTHQSSASLVVSRLVQLGLVERRTAADDARRIELRQTAAGRRRLARAPHAAQEKLVAAVEALGVRRRAQLGAVLERLATSMELPGGRPPMLFDEERRRPPGERRRATRSAAPRARQRPRGQRTR
jgi:DNA-binding MarR family transcriptional regulator